MSNYKSQLINYLKSMDSISADEVLSIGNQEDDLRYFKSANFKELKKLDINREFCPDILFDLNKPVQDDAGMIGIPEEYFVYFNLVLAFNLFEYIYDPLTAIKNIYQMMAYGGELLVNFPFVYPIHNQVSMDYLRYTPVGAVKLLKAAGFSRITIDQYFYGINDNLKDFYVDDGMKMAKDGDINHNLIGFVIRAIK